MIDRRQFFHAVTVISAGALISGARSMGGDVAIGKVAAGSFAMVIYDERLPASRAFARGAKRNGISASELGGDAGELWYNTIRPRLRLIPHRLLGLTLASDLFLLKLLAADVGMKVWHEVPQSPSGSMVSWVIASGVAA